ncbi:hypothetical protein [Oerskovia sp. KBS0722]|uniref:hypothetical protein n=1 Tax=Oerskovia sp. KBS0722 TaxID=1179673 RepID=UPI00143D5B67|nr:hypothetical protein [Oerskovia sp. KBS0722]
MRRMALRVGTRVFAGTTAALLLVVGLILGALPATAGPVSSSGGPDPQGVGLEVDVSGITSRSQVEADPGTAVAGGTLVVRGYGLVPFATYDVDLRSAYAPPVRLATVVALADGTFELSTRLPGSVRPGTHVVRVTDPATGTHLDTAGFEVAAATGPGTEPGGGPGGGPGSGSGPGGGPGTGPDPGAGPGGAELAATGPLLGAGGVQAGVPAAGDLAFTGATVEGVLAAAGALVVTGVVAVTGSRRRRRARTT